MVTDATPRPPEATSGYVRMVAVVVTLFALSTAMRAAQALLAPSPEAVATALLWAALLVAIASTAIAWLRPRFIALAIIGIPLGFMLVNWDLFDDPSFAATIAAVPVVLALMIAAWAFLVLPFLIRRQVRLPARLADAFQPCADAASLPAPLRAATEPLRALGFEPLATLGDTTGSERLDGAILLAPSLPYSATALYLVHQGHALVVLRLSGRRQDRSSEVVSVADRMYPDFLPAPDNEVEYLFPAATAAELLANLDRLVPQPQPVQALSREACLAQLARDKDARLEWWIARGWVEPNAVAGQHRITLRGGFVAVWRMLWPGRAIIAARRRRAGAEALSRLYAKLQPRCDRTTNTCRRGFSLASVLRGDWYST